MATATTRVGEVDVPVGLFPPAQVAAAAVAADGGAAGSAWSPAEAAVEDTEPRVPLPPREIRNITAWAFGARADADQKGIGSRVDVVGSAPMRNLGDRGTLWANALPNRDMRIQQYADTRAGTRHLKQHDHKLADAKTLQSMRDMGYPHGDTPMDQYAPPSVPPCDCCGRRIKGPPRMVEYLPPVSRTSTRAGSLSAPSRWAGNWCGWHCAFSEATFGDGDPEKLAALTRTCAQWKAKVPPHDTLVPPFLLRRHVIGGYLKEIAALRARVRHLERSATSPPLRMTSMDSDGSDSGGSDDAPVDVDMEASPAAAATPAATATRHVASAAEMGDAVQKTLEAVAEMEVADGDVDGGFEGMDADAALADVQRRAGNVDLTGVRVRGDEADADEEGAREDDAEMRGRYTILHQPIGGIAPVDDGAYDPDDPTTWVAQVAIHQGRAVPQHIVLSMAMREQDLDGKGPVRSATIFNDRDGDVLHLVQPKNLPQLKPKLTGRAPLLQEYVEQRERGVADEDTTLHHPLKPMSRRRTLLSGVDATKKAQSESAEKQRAARERKDATAEGRAAAEEEEAARLHRRVIRARSSVVASLRKTVTASNTAARAAAKATSARPSSAKGRQRSSASAAAVPKPSPPLPRTAASKAKAKATPRQQAAAPAKRGGRTPRAKAAPTPSPPPTSPVGDRDMDGGAAAAATAPPTGRTRRASAEDIAEVTRAAGEEIGFTLDGDDW